MENRKLIWLLSKCVYSLKDEIIFFYNKDMSTSHRENINDFVHRCKEFIYANNMEISMNLDRYKKNLSLLDINGELIYKSSSYDSEARLIIETTKEITKATKEIKCLIK